MEIGNNRFLRGDFIEVESAIRKAFDLKPELMWGFGSSFSVFYFAVGHFDKAYEMIDMTLQNDPLNLNNRGFSIIRYCNIGDTKRAEDAYEGIRALNPDHLISSGIITMTRLGSQDSVSRDKIPEIPMCDPIWAFVRDHVDSPEDVLLELHRIYNNDADLNPFILIVIQMWAAYFGDPKLALEVMEKAYVFDAMALAFLWTPIMREVRQLPRFKEFVREIGLFDYWSKFGWPDFCHQLGKGDFEFD